ncbi:MAG: tetratricopeptide (TPR) repeat protein [Vicingaceae bacterium]|jgi:tetratricopeptide (TPR) repeat protein
MGGGGSMQSMQTVLKNNRKLLDGRKKRGFFKRELSYAQVRKYYKDSSIPCADGGNRIPVDHKQIRQRLLKQRRKNGNMQIVLFVIVVILLSLGMFSVLSKTKKITKQKIQYQRAPQFVLSDGYDSFMAMGKDRLLVQNYFLAIGNYQRALQVRPNQRKAEFGLAKAYSKSCQYKNQFCIEAERFIKEMEEKYPNQVAFTQLKARYLVSQ